MWLLDYRLTYDLDLAMGTRKRVARVLLDKEHGTRLRKDVAYKLNAPNRAEMGAAWKRAKDDVRKPGVFWDSEIVVGLGGDLTLCGERLPGPSQLVREAGAMTEYDHASTQYSYLSSTGHPTMYTLMESIEFYEDETGGLKPRENISYHGVAVLTINAVAAFHAAWRLLTVWLGHKEIETTATRPSTSARIGGGA